MVVKNLKKIRIPKLLCPVSNWPMLRAAVESGCDEVYFGTKELNMRVNANNFELSELSKIVSFCHEHDVRANLCVNTIIYDSELKKLDQVLLCAKNALIDAIICWDFSVISKCFELKLPFHVSTQASISNFESVKQFVKLGATRVILARELSFEQIKQIKEKIVESNLDVEVECFVHGAMCVSVSGRCFLSQDIFNRSANRGDCLQPCRREYLVKDIDREFELVLGKDYIMSPKDLCAIEFLEKLVGPIDVMKIEGRGRSPEYVKLVTSCYRSALDAISQGKYSGELKEELVGKLKTVYNRGFSTGFYLGKPLNEWTKNYGSESTIKKEFIGFVKNYYKKIQVAEIKILAEELKIGDTIMIQGNKSGVFEQKIKSIQFNGTSVKIGSKGQSVGILLEREARTNDKVFRLSEISNSSN
ncbi:U32 family peptidase [Candidatus Woesearchaeota archaeon]|jgi:U32 family peptidase|nr:U32 family peptidase [Candidatus Woesearchaeota archaeon]